MKRLKKPVLKVPKYVASDFKWFEKGGLITWYDQRKYEKIIENPDCWLKNI